MKTRVKRYACGAAILSALCLSATGACANDSNNTYGIGIEGFHDSFDGRFPDLSGSDYTEKTDEGSVTGYFVHNWRGFFAALDGRASYGTADFNSSLFGSASGMQQFEFELRARFGKTYSLWGGAISPYVGLGVLYHEDEAKGYYTNGGTDGEAGLYDRDVTQLYIPIGASFSFATDGGWSITPQAEGDVLFYGDADSRFTNTPILTDQGAFQAANFNTNTQNFGLGGRGDAWQEYGGLYGAVRAVYSLLVGERLR